LLQAWLPTQPVIQLTAIRPTIPSLTGLIRGRSKLPLTYLINRLVHVGEEESQGDDHHNDVVPRSGDAHDVGKDDSHGHRGHAVAAVVDDHSQGTRVAGLPGLLAVAVVEDLVTKRCRRAW